MRHDGSTSRFPSARAALAAAASLVLLLAAAPPAEAADARPVGPPPRQVPGKPVDVSDRVHLDLGLEVPTKYYWRGFLVEDSGFIAQPCLELGVDLLSEGWPLDRVSLVAGTWDTILTGPAGEARGESDWDGWYEADFWVGLHVGFSGGISFGVEFQAFTSPCEAFSVMEEWDLVVEWDDEEAWGDGRFAGLRPRLLLAFESVGQSDAGDEEGVCVEAALAPTWRLGRRQDRPLLLSAPLTLGLSLEDYYEDADGTDEVFGYLDAGLELAVPLCFVPESAGAWTATVGLHGIVRGDHAREAGGGSTTDGYAVLGVHVGF